LVILRFGLAALMAVLWALRRKHALFQLIIIAQRHFHCGLARSDKLLDLCALRGRVGSGQRANARCRPNGDIEHFDFSIWYWLIDPPGIEEVSRAEEPWDFLFPQLSSALPHYDGWVPRYADYLFVAFTTSFAFSPTDTLPLTRRAKMLMLLQAAISVVTLTGVAGSAINILAGAK
jgi:hypothetical protein